MSNRIYLVPHDFSAVCNAATNHAIAFAKPVSATILIVHLVDNASKIPTAKTKMEAYIKTLKLPFNVKADYKVVKGSIFEDIGKIAEGANANRVIMGTHGAKGFQQKVFGSFAIKVIQSTNTPFVVVQDSTPYEKIDNIVMPIDLSKESLQIINHAADIASVFKSKIHVVGENQRDEILARQMKNRIKLVEKKYEELGVNASIELFESSGSYSSKVLKYAKKVNAEMIALAYYTESLIPTFDNYAQSLLTNTEKIPVLIIRSNEVSSTYF